VAAPKGQVVGSRGVKLNVHQLFLRSAVFGVAPPGLVGGMQRAKPFFVRAQSVVVVLILSRHKEPHQVVPCVVAPLPASL